VDRVKLLSFPIKSSKTSCDCPSSIFLTYNFGTNEKSYKGNKNVSLYNSNSIFLKPHEKKIIHFNQTFMTTFPAMCLLYANEFSYRKGISFQPNFVRTNDTYLNITIFNHTCNPIYLKPYDLHVICVLIFPGINF
jgi:hypothetical protein